MLYSTKNDTVQYDDEVSQKYKDFQQEYKYIYSSIPCTATELLCNLPVIKEQSNNISIIDIACGDGNVSRYVYDNIDINTSILGIDISKSQIEIAQKSTATEIYSSIRYEIGNAEYLYKDEYKHLHDSFDIALVFWFFPHAQNITVFNNMITSVYNVLKPNGYAIGATMTCENTNLLKETYGDTDLNEFGFLYHDYNDKKDGDKMGFQIGSFEFVSYYYSPNTYKNVAKDNGFKECIFLDENRNGYNYVANPNLTKDNQQLFMKHINCPHGWEMFVMEK